MASGIILGVLVALMLAVAAGFNKLVKNRNLMQEAWSVVDVFLKKRHDLVPNLVSTVKGYAAHEKATLETVARCRAEAMQAQEQKTLVASERRLGQAITNLMVVVENDPDLKANTGFLRLQQQLIELENDLESARRYYNGTVRVNNTHVEMFPTNIVAFLFGFKSGVFFEASAADQKTPQVSM